jgi:hypothetical protein
VELELHAAEVVGEDFVLFGTYHERGLGPFDDGLARDGG